MRQLNLFCEKVSLEFGGSLLGGRRKAQRPLSTKHSLHLVLKATNPYFLLRARRETSAIIRFWAERFGVRIYGLAVNADHVHLQARVPSRAAYTRWIRAITSRLVAQVRGLKFSLRPYSRLVSWGWDSRRLRGYLAKNSFEAELILRAWAIVRGHRRAIPRNFQRPSISS